MPSATYTGAPISCPIFMRIDDDLEARPTADSVQVFLGDYIDRGPNSRQENPATLLS
jgi:hypothetical protein